MSHQIILNFILLQLFLLKNLKAAGECHNQARKHFMIDMSDTLNVSCFYNFNSFADLMRENCSQTYNTTQYVQFSSRAKIIVDMTYDFRRLFDHAHLIAIEQILFTNLKGYDLNTHSLFNKRPAFSNTNLALELIFSKFDVFSDGTLITNCDQRVYPNKTHFLSQFNTLLFNQVIYPKSIY